MVSVLSFSADLCSNSSPRDKRNDSKNVAPEGTIRRMTELGRSWRKCLYLRSWDLLTEPPCVPCVYRVLVSDASRLQKTCATIKATVYGFRAGPVFHTTHIEQPRRTLSTSLIRSFTNHSDDV